MAAEPGGVAAGIRRAQREAALARHRLRQQLATPAELGLPPATARLQLITGITRCRARLLELIGAEQHEHLVMNPDLVFTEEAVRAAAPAHRLLVDRSITVMEVGVPPAPGDATGELVGALAASGAQFRDLPDIPTKIMIFDRTTAVVRWDPGNPQRLLEVTDRSTVTALVGLFFRHWERAEEHRARNAMDLTPRELAIVRLMAAGHTDAATAAELGLSLRTIAYTTRNLMSRLGVQNRFQLGLVLGNLGDRLGAPAARTDNSEEHP
jgi:DNA-binding CsgD family transcriptional regulator